MISFLFYSKEYNYLYNCNMSESKYKSKYFDITELRLKHVIPALVDTVRYAPPFHCMVPGQLALTLVASSFTRQLETVVTSPQLTNKSNSGGY